MKKWITILSITLSGSVFANDLTRQAERISNRLYSVEDQLDHRDERDLRRLLDRAEEIIDAYEQGGYGNGQDRLICASNGSMGSLEKFAIFKEGVKIGGWTSSKTCQELRENQRNRLVCTSNGSMGSLEKFKVYDLKNNQYLGGESTLGHCQSVIQNSSPSFVCLSNGSMGSLEKFSLWDRSVDRKIGGETSLENCIRSAN